MIWKHWIQFLTVCAVALAATPRAVDAAASFEQLLAQLESDDWVLQAEAIAQLADADAKRAAQVLGPLVDDKARPAWVRGRALHELAEIDKERAQRSALTLARSASPQLRSDALIVLGGIGGSSAQTVVEAALRDKQPLVRASAINAMARLDASRAWPMLENAYPEATAETLPIYAATLPLIGNSEARKLCAELLEHEDPIVRRSVIKGLGEQSDEPSLRLLMDAAGSDPLPSNRQAAVRMLLRIDEARRAELIRAGLQSEEKSKLHAAVALLEEAPDEDLTNDVAIALQRLEKAERLTQGLGILLADRPQRFTEIFRGYLKHDSSSVRTLAVEGIAASPQVNRWEALGGMLGEGNDKLRGRIVDLLIEAGAPEKGVMAYIENPLAGGNERQLDIRRLMRRFLTEEELYTAAMRMKNWLNDSRSYRRNKAYATLENALTTNNSWRVASALGYLHQWRIIGPFDNDDKNTGFKTEYPPEKELDFDDKYEGSAGHTAQWRDYRLTSAEGFVPVHSIMPLPSHYRVAYAYTVINAPEAQEVRFDVVADDSIKIWLNGELIADHEDNRKFKVNAELKRGGNPMLVKIANQKDYWKFRIQVTDRKNNILDWVGKP